MSALIRRLFPSLGHLSDEALCRLIDDELGPVRDLRAGAHLASCWQCRARCEQLEKAAHQVVEYRKFLVLPKLPQDSKRRDSFIAEVDKLLAEALRVPLWRKAGSYFSPLSIKNTNPVFASMVVFAFAVVLLFVIWQRSVEPVSAAELLDRAQQWDNTSVHAAGPGVVYQKVRIKTARHTVERDLYRDREGRRKQKPEPASLALTPLKAKLDLAGVNWDEPLSAANYKEWHDRQEIKADQVKRTGNDLLTLTTTPGNGPVSQESLTVREADFHPVMRTVELPDADTIEIAELNYAVLSWDAVKDGLFEPLAPAVAPTEPMHVVIVPALPTPLQLEDAELQTRLVLNLLNADTSEQIRVTRTNAEVEVKGIVETEELKRKIIEQLQAIPHVNSSILSFEELRSSPRDSSPVTSVKEYALVGQPSPLGRYMQEKNLSPGDLSQMSQRLLDASLDVQQGSVALSELLSRFASAEQLSPEGRSARSQLIANYARILTAGLNAQESDLQELGFTSTPVGDEASQVRAVSDELMVEARRNQALCRELITGGGESPRPASAIALELFEAIARTRYVVAQLQSQSAGP